MTETINDIYNRLKQSTNITNFNLNINQIKDETTKIELLCKFLNEGLFNEKTKQEFKIACLNNINYSIDNLKDNSNKDNSNIAEIIINAMLTNIKTENNLNNINSSFTILVSTIKKFNISKINIDLVKNIAKELIILIDKSKTNQINILTIFNLLAEKSDIFKDDTSFTKNVVTKIFPIIDQNRKDSLSFFKLILEQSDDSKKEFTLEAATAAINYFIFQGSNTNKLDAFCIFADNIINIKFEQNDKIDKITSSFRTNFYNIDTNFNLLNDEEKIAYMRSLTNFYNNKSFQDMNFEKTQNKNIKSNIEKFVNNQTKIILDIIKKTKIQDNNKNINNLKTLKSLEDFYSKHENTKQITKIQTQIKKQIEEIIKAQFEKVFTPINIFNKKIIIDKALEFCNIIVNTQLSSNFLVNKLNTIFKYIEIESLKNEQLKSFIDIFQKFKNNSKIFEENKDLKIILEKLTQKNNLLGEQEKGQGQNSDSQFGSLLRSSLSLTNSNKKSGMKQEQNSDSQFQLQLTNSSNKESDMKQEQILDQQLRSLLRSRSSLSLTELDDDEIKKQNSDSQFQLQLTNSSNKESDMKQEQILDQQLRSLLRSRSSLSLTESDDDEIKKQDLDLQLGSLSISKSDLQLRPLSISSLSFTELDEEKVILTKNEAANLNNVNILNFFKQNLISNFYLKNKKVKLNEAINNIKVQNLTNDQPKEFIDIFQKFIQNFKFSNKYKDILKNIANKTIEILDANYENKDIQISCIKILQKLSNEKILKNFQLKIQSKVNVFITNKEKEEEMEQDIKRKQAEIKALEKEDLLSNNEKSEEKFKESKLSISNFLNLEDEEKFKESKNNINSTIENLFKSNKDLNSNLNEMNNIKELQEYINDNEITLFNKINSSIKQNYICDDSKKIIALESVNIFLTQKQKGLNVDSIDKAVENANIDDCSNNFRTQHKNGLNLKTTIISNSLERKNNQKSFELKIEGSIDKNNKNNNYDSFKNSTIKFNLPKNTKLTEFISNIRNNGFIMAIINLDKDQNKQNIQSIVFNFNNTLNIIKNYLTLNNENKNEFDINMLENFLNANEKDKKILSTLKRESSKNLAGAINSLTQNQSILLF